MKDDQGYHGMICFLFFLTQTPKNPPPCCVDLSMQVSELVTTESIDGPFQLNPGEQAVFVCPLLFGHF